MARMTRLLFCAALSLLIQGRGEVAYAQDNGRWSFSPSTNDYGSTGLLQMPSGRMHPDGTFIFGFSRNDPYTRFFLNTQILPWLQASLRYTDIGYAEYGKEISTQSYKDKAVDFKIRLTEESENIPELSLGFRDVGGTGVFSSEFIAASKRYYSLDFTGGVAWGNMGSRAHLPNPLGFFSEGAKVRPSDSAAGTPGTLNTSFFRGENIGLFGGVEWATPLSGVNLKVEYDSNSYQKEFRGQSLEVTSPFNVGVSYRPFNWLDLGLGYERGNSVMFRGALVSNFETDTGVPNFDEKPPLSVAEAPGAPGKTTAQAAEESQQFDQVAPDMIDSSVDRLFDRMQEQGVLVASLDMAAPVVTVTLDSGSVQDRDSLSEVALAIAQMPTISGVKEVEFRSKNGEKIVRLDAERLLQKKSVAGTVAMPAVSNSEQDVAKRLFTALEYYGFSGLRLSISGKRATVVYSQSRYSTLPIAFGRVARALALVTPETVTEFDLIEEALGVPIARVVFARQDVIRAALQLESVDELWMNAQTPAPEVNEDLDWIYNNGIFPQFSWSLSPQLRQSVGGPNNFYLYQIYGSLGASLQLTRHFGVAGNIGANITNNYDNFTYDAPSKMQRVRTDIRSYLIDRDYWLDSLHADYVTALAPNWYGRVSGGIFELMYGGIDGEILYRPMGKRWALGLDINHVWQRDFEGRFGFKDYDVTTGHLTWYQTLPFKGVEGTVSIGRYLAKDVGVTISIGRQFENGMRLGAWATKTNVSSDTFGEGAFDKGIYVTIPFELFTTTPTKARGNIAFRPLMRDGGAKVNLPVELYAVTGNGGVSTSGWEDTMK